MLKVIVNVLEYHKKMCIVPQYRKSFQEIDTWNM